MANEARILWGTITSFSTLTNLHSLADTNIWQSGVITQANDPTDMILRIWYQLEMATSPTTGDLYRFYFAEGSGHGTTDIWPGNISESEGEISAAGEKVDVQEALVPVHTHVWKTNGDLTLSGKFDLWVPAEDWQVLIEAVGHALAASGSTLQYQVGSLQQQ